MSRHPTNTTDTGKLRTMGSRHDASADIDLINRLAVIIFNFIVIL
jgi:hypothetical protein